MKCKYSEWSYTNKGCYDDVCTLCTSGTLYCYDDNKCPNYVPDIKKDPINEKVIINQLCNDYLDGYSVGIV